MDINDLKTMLNRVYELEGLLELAATRDPGRIPALAPLIINKCRELNLLADEMAADSDSREELPEPSAPEYLHEEAPQDEQAPVDEEAPELQQPVDDDSNSELAGFSYADYPFPEEEELMKRNTETPEPQPVVDPESEPELEPKPIEEPEAEPEPVEEPEPEPVKQRPTPKRQPVAKRFSINDNFRFRREIFDGNADNFTQSLCLIDRMETFSEAEEYFYTDLQLDPDNAVVVEFMNIIRRHFGA